MNSVHNAISVTKSNTVYEVHTAHDEDKKCIPNFGWKISVRPPGMSTWLKNNIKMDVGEIGNEGMNWTEQSQDMVGFCCIYLFMDVLLCFVLCSAF